jgi:hypothetical protein
MVEKYPAQLFSEASLTAEQLMAVRQKHPVQLADIFVMQF